MRLGLVLASSLLLAGCFQPIYGARSIGASTGAKDKLAAVAVPPVDVPNGTSLARVSVEMRNALLFQLTGGGPAAPPAYTLKVTLGASQQQVIVDINTNRPEVQNYGINAYYSLVDNATGKTVMTAQTFSRVSYNIPGQEQRFAGARGLRDAENRAAKVIADNIHARLVSYFVAGT
ncbi:MAG TPA: LPS assembly lipoprotein LptE [Pseudolabrys sp.]|nr:LPS assembly lipoprotein LptE [Pseudolabrys sp.]